MSSILRSAHSLNTLSIGGACDELQCQDRRIFTVDKSNGSFILARGSCVKPRKFWLKLTGRTPQAVPQADHRLDGGGDNVLRWDVSMRKRKSTVTSGNRVRACPTPKNRRTSIAPPPARLLPPAPVTAFTI
jgi:hypothetical protein